MKVVAGGGEWNPAVARVGRYSCAPIKVESIDANHLGWAELEIKDICVFICVGAASWGPWSHAACR